MRILNITAQKPISTGSGVYMTELMRAFSELGHVQAAVAGVYKEDGSCIPEDIEFYPLCFKTEELPFPIPGMSDEMPYESTVYSTMTEDMAAAFKAAFVKRIGEAVESFRPDVILCHHLYLVTAFVREMYPHMKVFGACHGTGLRQIMKNGRWKEYIAPKICALDGIFCLHEGQKRDICSCYGADENKVHVIGSGFNSSIFCPRETESHEGYRISFAGKISDKKGVFSLVRALSHLPFDGDRVKLTLAGGYNEENYCKVLQLAALCPYEVTLTGPLPQDKLAQLFAGSDLFVLPSFYEGLPLVLAEAMACGARAVCTDLTGIKEWMDENVPGHGIRFVNKPSMLDADTPDPAALPEFERELAAAIEEALLDTSPHAPALDRVSWKGVAKAVERVFLG